jgi:hypothetical protein
MQPGDFVVLAKAVDYAARFDRKVEDHFGIVMSVSYGEPEAAFVGGGDSVHRH